MTNNIENTKNVMNQTRSKQSGFAILMGLLVLVLGAAAWYGSLGNIKTETMKKSVQDGYINELESVKKRMLMYAVFNPEVFDSEDNSNPGPGYFPCPDVSGNGRVDTGNQCAQQGNLYAMGWVPQRIVDRSFSFLHSGLELENKRYWFAVDVRFLSDGGVFNFAGLSNRFAPLNINTPLRVDPTGASLCDEDQQNPPLALPANCIAPLTVDGQGDIVMVLFYAGDDITTGAARDLNQTAQEAIGRYLEQPSLTVPSSDPAHNAPGVFVSQGNGVAAFNDYVITITREEWNAAVLSRVAQDLNNDSIPDLCLLDPLVGSDATGGHSDSWFNRCRFTGTNSPPYAVDPGDPDDPYCIRSNVVPGAQNNIEGQNWRAALGCP